MSEFSQLEDLWHQQAVSLPSRDVLKRKWRTQRRKQWAWVVMDLLAGGLAVAAMLYFWDRPMEPWVKLWVFGFAGLGIVLTPYMLWLRRSSFRSGNLSTQAYFEHLQKQCANNIKIAKLTQVFIVVTLVIHQPWQWYYWTVVKAGVIEWSHVITMNAFVIGWLGGFWWWSTRHIKTYRQELSWLSSFANDGSEEKLGQ